MPENPLCLEYNRLMVLDNTKVVGFNPSVDHSSNLISSTKKKITILPLSKILKPEFSRVKRGSVTFSTFHLDFVVF